MTGSTLPSTERDELRLHRLLFAAEAERVETSPQLSERARAAEALDAAADALLAPGGALHTLGLGVLDSAPGGQEAKTHLAAAFAHARTLWPGLTVPTPEDFAEAGLQFGSLAEALAKDPTLLAVVAPHGLGWEAWRDAFAGVQAPELIISSEVRDAFALLDRVLERDASPVRDDSGGLVWTCALIPAAAQPQLLGLNHARGPHPSIAEMLSLQVRCLLTGVPLVDAHSFTWIAGRFGEDKLAARHVFDVEEHSIRVSSRSAAQQGPHQGARPPVRG